MSTEFGKRLRKLRTDRGMTQSDVANFIKKSSSAVRMWELGKNEPGIFTLIELSRFFDCTLDYLLCKDLKSGDGKIITTDVPVFTLDKTLFDAEPLKYSPLPSRYVKDNNDYFIVLNTNEDMEPIFQRNDMILCRRQDSCLNAHIALVELDGKEPILRKVIFQSGGFVLQPANIKSDACFIAFDDQKSSLFCIHGIAIELIREI